MKWALIAVLSVCLAETLMRLPLAKYVRNFTRLLDRSMWVLKASGVSDHWKERAMGAYAMQTFKTTGILVGMLTIVVVLAVVITLFFSLFSPGFDQFVMSWIGILVSTVIACAYAFARFRWMQSR